MGELEFLRNIRVASAKDLSIHRNLAPVSERFEMKINAGSGVAPRSCSRPVAYYFLRSPQICCHASNSLGLIW
jgi:hypothetical protein